MKKDPRPSTDSPPLSSTCSPFFQKRLRSPHQNRKRSIHFLRAPSSAFGSIRSFGCWVQSLANKNDDGDDDEAAAPAVPVTIHESNALALALRHFENCPEFQFRWKRRDDDNAENADDDDRLHNWEQRLSRAVRHLCPHRCYMRAFAPYRDWHALRSSIVETFPDCNVDEVLRGWSCILRRDVVTWLPRTTFLSPQGRRFTSANEVIRYLSTNDGQHLDHMKIVCESSGRLIRQTESVWSPYRATQGCSDPFESPFGLLEELFVDDPWRLLLSTILLNRTTRRQVDSVMHEFLRIWPNCSAFLDDNERTNDKATSAVLKPLGMNLRRAAGVLRFCEDYQNAVAEAAVDLSMDPEEAAFHLTKSHVLRLYNCGEYASSAYRIFIQRSYDFDPGDHALTMYAEYKRGEAQLTRNSCTP